MSQSFIEFVKILGKGKNGSRSLTQMEAYQAMSLILDQRVQPEQVGAFWMLIRIREETVDETVGFTRAVREKLSLSSKITVDIDWPTYAGKRSELPWFVLAALALGQSGLSVFMHGHQFLQEERLYVESIVSGLGLPHAMSFDSVRCHLAKCGFAYMALSDVSPVLAQQMHLKTLLGLRSPVNTVVRMMNPLDAKHSVHGVFHKGYDELHMQSCLELQDKSVLIFRGGNGEAEINPERDVMLGYCRQNRLDWRPVTKVASQHCHQKNTLDLQRMRLHWQGQSNDVFGGLAVIQTMNAVLSLVHPNWTWEQCELEAACIWRQRNKSLLTHQHVA